jgi:AcrR family transcriptional regulator
VATGPGRGLAEGAGRRAAHVEDTRRALLQAAREHFAEHGFQGTRTEDVVQAAGLTRGALYHHFRDKEDLFRAVFEEVSDEVAPLLWRRLDEHGADAWTRFRANSEIYLEAASTNRAYRQIVLIDGPAVLGWDYWSARHDGPTRTIGEYLRQAIAEGVLDPLPVEPLAQLLTSLGVGSTMYIAHAADHETARQEVSRCNVRLLAGLPRRVELTEHPVGPPAAGGPGSPPAEHRTLRRSTEDTTTS